MILVHLNIFGYIFFSQLLFQFIFIRFFQTPKSHGEATTQKMYLLTVTTCMLALLSSVRCEADSKPSVENGVLVLTQANFQAAVKDNEFVLVEFCKYPVTDYFIIFFFNLIFNDLNLCEFGYCVCACVCFIVDIVDVVVVVIVILGRRYFPCT